MPFHMFFFYDGLSCLIQWLTVYLQAVFPGISIPDNSVEIGLLLTQMAAHGAGSYAAQAAAIL